MGTGIEEAYQAAVADIEGIVRFTSKNALSHTVRAMEYLGGPEGAFSVLHVAGTNGKGSCCAYLEAVLRAGGYRTGLFTSPHLVDTRERFRVDGEIVSEETFLDAYRTVKDAAGKLAAEGETYPTYFEFLFLMSLVIFRKAGVEVAVMETGLGGRLDATNVLRPLVSVITSVSLDHMQYLGDTVEAIAAEKAGIIKEGVPVVFDDTDERVCGVIRRKAEEMHAPVKGLSEAGALSAPDGGMLTVKIPGTPFAENGLRLRTKAAYQADNAVLAFMALAFLQDAFPVPEEAVRKGFGTMRWDGRMQELPGRIFLDGAHNEGGIRAFAGAAEAAAQGRDITLLFAAMKDKDYGTMIRYLCGRLHPKTVVATETGSARSLPADTLAGLFSEAGAPAAAVPDMKEAFAYAKTIQGDGVLFVVGSLYLIGGILKLYDQL